MLAETGTMYMSRGLPTMFLVINSAPREREKAIVFLPTFRSYGTA
jgi:hypothetical protein